MLQDCTQPNPTLAERLPERAGDAEHCEECDTVVFAVGRRPCTLGLGLDQAGVQLSAGGKVLADKWGRTHTSV